jgi:hypothetical protein
MICLYCGTPAKLIDSAQIYGGRSFGPAWACGRYPTCDAYVGCHRGTERPLGRLANAELRRAKQAAHAVFDPLWQAKMRLSRISKKTARNAAYQWLARELGIPESDCHIGMFDVDACRRVVEICERVAGATREKFVNLNSPIGERRHNL